MWLELNPAIAKPQNPTDTVSNRTELNLFEPKYPTQSKPAADKTNANKTKKKQIIVLKKI